MNEQSLARGLSFFSLGLGLAELLAPRQVARLAGINSDHDNLIRMLGLREITSGLGIMQGKAPYFLWSRVAGDAIDLALLGAAHRSTNNDRRRVNIAIAAVAGVTALDVIASILASRDGIDPAWRVQSGDSYSSGFGKNYDPRTLYAPRDEAISDSAARLRREDEEGEGAATSGSPNALDRLAEDDDGLGESTRPAGAPDFPRSAPI